MNYRLLWTHGTTATVSFALCWVLTHQSNPSQRVATAAAQTVNSSSSNSTSSQADASEEATTRTRVAKRDKSKKSTEQKISLPLTTIANMIRGEQFRDYFDFHDLQAKMENSLNLLGTSEQEKNDVLALLKKTESEIYAEEKKWLRVIQTQTTEIRLDNLSLGTFSKTLAPKIQEGIRASLRADLADVLISSTKWDQLYPTGGNSFPTFTITRSLTGRMTAWVRQFSGGRGSSVGQEFPEDGTPIPADQVFKDERWNSFLKGLTLLPKDEE